MSPLPGAGFARAHMADALTNTAEARALDWLSGAGSPTRPTAPLMCRAMTANGNDATGGTEVTGGSYAPQTITISGAGTSTNSNTANLEFAGMPACTVVGVEIWDSATTPIRLWWGALAGNQVVNVGNTFRILAGQLTWSIS